jgi:hypothetical protein
MMGDAPAEQNHASVAAHLGDGASWSIPEHVQQLIERQNTLEKQLAHRDNKLYTSTLMYRSKLIGVEKKNEEIAKKHLTSYAFEHLFVRARDFSKELLTEKQANGSFLVWPHYRDKDSDRTIVLLVGQRCVCRDRIAFQFQCCRELVCDTRFDIEKYDPRWLMTRIFRHKFPCICQMPSPVVSLDTSGIESTPAMYQPTPMEDNAHDGESISGEIDLQSYQVTMNYTFALSRCAALSKTAGHDKVFLPLLCP